MLISRGDVKSRDLLPLVLPQLIVGVGDLKPVPGAQDVEVEHVLAVRIVVEVVENGAAVADGVNRRELRRIQETGPNEAS